MRTIHHLILCLPVLVTACASNPLRCDRRLQPVNAPAAVAPPAVSAPARAADAPQRGAP